jgi:hypothetical protein
MKPLGVRRTGGTGLRQLACGPLPRCPPDTQVWPQCPATVVPPWSGRGRPPTRLRVPEGEPEPISATPWAARLPAQGWRRRTIQEGRTGPLLARVAKMRVMAGREGVPGPDVWLVRRYPVGTRELKTDRSNASVTTALARLVWVSGMRWPIETKHWSAAKQ